jgi:hypothetical protein
MALMLACPVIINPQGFIDGLAAPMLAALGATLPFVADVALPLAAANAAAWADAAAAAAPPAAPERPRIGETGLACAAEHGACRAAAAAAAAAASAAALAAPPAAPLAVAVV